MLSRRGFFGLFGKATLAVASAKIPIASSVAKIFTTPPVPPVTKIAEKYGWVCVTINGERRYLPFWN